MTNKLQNTNDNRHGRYNRFNVAAPVLARQIEALSDPGREPLRQIQDRLNRLGYGGLDNSLIAGIKQFQKDHGLQADGVIKAGGETLRKLNQLSSDPQNFRPIATALPDTSGLSLREELEGRFNGTLPIVRTDPQTGFRSAYYFGRENETTPLSSDRAALSMLPQALTKKDINAKPHNYFRLPEDCHNPRHLLRMHLRRLNWGGQYTSPFLPDHTGYSMISTCDDGRQFINMQDLEKTDDDKIIFNHNYTPARNYLTDHGIVTWSTEIPEKMKVDYDNMTDYLNDKNVSHRVVALGNEAERIYNLMGFENELINAVSNQQKPTYRKVTDNCNTSTQWKKDNHFPKLRNKSISDIMNNKVWGDKEYTESFTSYNDHYQIVDAARNALLAHNPKIDFAEICNIHWSDINQPQGEMMRFSDNQRNYIVDKNPNYRGTYQVMVQSRRK